MIFTNKHTLRWGSYLVVIAALFAGLLFASPTYTAHAQPATPETAAPNGEAAEVGTNCAVEQIGWILCPLIKGIGKIADKVYSTLANHLLKIDAELLTSNPNTKGTITAWEYARNLANIAFIIAFLIIIYSQITGAGLNNYGIKRMLPRLVIAAIAVNVSFYICQAMVDISNILGYEIKNALTSIAKEIGPLAMEGGAAAGQGLDTQTADGNLGLLATIAMSVLAIAGVAWIFTGLLGTIGLLILITIVTIICILLLRKAFIVILVVLSPLAFVAYLLPNTEKYFHKWLNMFWQLLMVFPIVALLFGGGQLASTIVLVAGANSNSAQQTAQNCDANGTPTNQGQNGQPANNTSDGYTVQCEPSLTIENNGHKTQSGMMLGLVAAGIAIAPLLFVWSVLKGALAAAGAIGGKIAGAIDNASKGKRDSLKKNYGEDKERRKQERQIRAMDGNAWRNPVNVATLGMSRRGARRRARNESTKSRYNKEYLGYVARTAQNKDGELSGFGKQLAGGIGPFGTGASEAAQGRALSNAINAQVQLDLEEVKAAHATIDNLDESGLDDIIGNAKNFNDPKLAAALERYAKIGDKTKLANYTNAVGKGGNTIASRALGGAMAGEGYLKPADVDEISRGAMGGNTIQQRALNNINADIYSPDKLASAGKSELDFMHAVARGGTSIDHVNAKGKLRSAATKAQSDDRLKIKISRNKDVIDRMSSGNWQPPPPSP